MTTATVERRLATIEATVRTLRTGMAPRWDSPLALAADVEIELDDWQQRVLASRARRLILKGPRQIGKSTVSGLLSLHVALTIAESLVLLIAPSQDQSKENARTVQRMAARIGLATTEHIEAITPTALSASRIEFANGSRVVALPGRNDATVRGWGAPDLIVSDEASRIAESTLDAIRPMLVAHPTGRWMLLSTPWAKAGTFYRTWTSDSPGWERIEVATADCPRLTPEYIEAERQELPPWVFAREYLGEFSDDDATIFPAELIDAAISCEVVPLFPRGLAHALA